MGYVNYNVVRTDLKTRTSAANICMLEVKNLLRFRSIKVCKLICSPSHYYHFLFSLKDAYFGVIEKLISMCPPLRMPENQAPCSHSLTKDLSMSHAQASPHVSLTDQCFLSRPANLTRKTEIKFLFTFYKIC